MKQQHLVTKHVQEHNKKAHESQTHFIECNLFIFPISIINIHLQYTNGIRITIL